MAQYTQQRATRDIRRRSIRSYTSHADDLAPVHARPRSTSGRLFHHLYSIHHSGPIDDAAFMLLLLLFYLQHSLYGMRSVVLKPCSPVGYPLS